jgi:tetratricopeptide (TPR) repeat protein
MIEDREMPTGEESLIAMVKEEDLQSSLREICRVAGDIWDNNDYRIIHNFFDSGINHCKRLADFAAKLLEDYGNDFLSEREMYLLIAGIYLHDIGMQCDVKKYDKIKQIAEEHGANFKDKFDINSNEYSIVEQTAIYDDHQYLSAAWISHAKSTGDTILSKAVQNIPDDILVDLMDICKYHSRLPIAECPPTFKLDLSQRKQLVASILRLCEEMDVKSHQIDIDAIKNFGKNSFDIVHLWLYNVAEIAIHDDNSLHIRIGLRANDKEKYGRSIHSIFITEFQTRNRPIIMILRQNGIQASISQDSAVVVNDNALPIPSEITHYIALEDLQEPINRLANEIRIWLRALQYEVTVPVRKNNHTIEMKATLGSDISILVRCISGNVELLEIDALGRELDEETPRAWIISDSKISPNVMAVATKRIQIFDLSSFLQYKIWGPYFSRLINIVKGERIPEWYVDLACYRQEEGKDDRISYRSLDEYIDQWLEKPEKLHISILGDFGSGKTWFCRHYVYRQLMRYINEPIDQRLPLLITLRDFSKAMTVQQLINDALLEQYNLPFIGSAYDIFQEMNRRGKILLVLDGFDEMARKVDYQTIVENFLELKNLVNDNSKVILTCRTEYFRWTGEADKILGGEKYGRITIVLSAPSFEVLYLQPLDDELICKFISKRLGDVEGIKVSNQVLKNRMLAEMARKPVLMQLLLTSLEHVESINKPSMVYLYATNALLLQNIKTRRSFTSTADKLYFLCELAWDMIKKDELRIHFKDIPERIRTYFKDKIVDSVELDHWDWDLRAQTLLHRDSLGYYSFANKSISEYFVALKFAAELGCISPIFETTYLESEGVPSKMPYKIKNIFELSRTFGERSLRSLDMKTVRELLSGMMSEGAPIRLWRVIDETSDKSSNEVGFCGGNAATLLQDLGVWHSPTYEDMPNLLEGMLNQPESIFPARPANIIKMEQELKKLGIVKFSKNESIEIKPSENSYVQAIEAYQAAKENHLEAASNLAISSAKINPNLRLFNLSSQAYVGLQALYLNDIKGAEKYLKRYLKCGGNPIWYHLKLSLVRLHERRIEEAIEEAKIVLRDSGFIDCSKLEALEMFGFDSYSNYEQLHNRCRSSIEILQGRALLLLGILERVDTEYDESIDLCLKALDIFVRQGDIHHEGVTLAHIAIAYRMKGDFDEAQNNFSSSFSIFARIADRYRMACVQARRGTVYRFQGDYEKAINDYLPAIETFKSLGESLLVGIVLKELGTTNLILGKWAEAIDNYKNALDIFQDHAVSDNPEADSRVGLTLYSLGFAFLMQGRWSESIEVFQKALGIFVDRNDVYNTSLTLSSIGSAFRMMDARSGASIYLRRALDIVNKLGDKNRESLILIKLGSVYRLQRKHSDAISCFERALENVRVMKVGHEKNETIFKRLIISEGKILGELGNIYRSMNELQKAIPFYNDALKTFIDLGDRAKVSWILEEIGQVYTVQGLYGKAIEEYKKALTNLQASSGTLVDESLVNLAQGYIMQGIFRGGIQTYKAALNEIERLGKLSVQAKALRNLGEAYRLKGEFDEALHSLEEALNIVQSIKDKDEKGKILCYLGLVHGSLAYSNLERPKTTAVARWNHYELAEINIEQSIKIFRQLGDRFLLSWSLESLGKIYMMEEMWKEAASVLKRAIKMKYSSSLVHLSLAICYKNLANEDLYVLARERALNSINIKGINEYELSYFEANCGDMAKAFELLKIALSKGQASIELIERDIYMKPICNDERFRNLKQSVHGAYSEFNIVPFM